MNWWRQILVAKKPEKRVRLSWRPWIRLRKRSHKGFLEGTRKRYHTDWCGLIHFASSDHAKEAFMKSRRVRFMNMLSRSKQALIVLYCPACSAAVAIVERKKPCWHRKETEVSFIHCLLNCIILWSKSFKSNSCDLVFSRFESIADGKRICKGAIKASLGSYCRLKTFNDGFCSLHGYWHEPARGIHHHQSGR